mmetsp:Transcript_25502/g.64281  ORF Transcript_25502/g.64281 Transcript_25502/m.64281 type:complete len:289 (-) Transcript_25502:120-986(-)
MVARSASDNPSQCAAVLSKISANDVGPLPLLAEEVALFSGKDAAPPAAAGAPDGGGAPTPPPSRTPTPTSFFFPAPSPPAASHEGSTICHRAVRPDFCTSLFRSVSLSMATTAWRSASSRTALSPKDATFSTASFVVTMSYSSSPVAVFTASFFTTSFTTRSTTFATTTSDRSTSTTNSARDAFTSSLVTKIWIHFTPSTVSCSSTISSFSKPTTFAARGCFDSSSSSTSQKPTARRTASSRKRDKRTSLLNNAVLSLISGLAATCCTVEETKSFVVSATVSTIRPHL